MRNGTRFDNLNNILEELSELAVIPVHERSHNVTSVFAAHVNIEHGARLFAAWEEVCVPGAHSLTEERHPSLVEIVRRRGRDGRQLQLLFLFP